MILSTRDKRVTGKMQLLVKTFIWCWSLAVFAAAAELLSYEPVISIQALGEVKPEKEALEVVLLENGETEKVDRAAARQKQAKMMMHGAELDESLSLKSSRQIFAQFEAREKDVEEESKRFTATLLLLKAWRMRNPEVVTAYTEKTSDPANSEALSSTTVPPLEFNSTVAPLPEETFTVVPSTALQAYVSSGFAGLIGKPLNIENELYKGEFLYLTRHSNGRISDIYNVATLPVGADKLRESAFQWELFPVPGKASSFFYLRNKLEPIPPKESLFRRWNYVSIETFPSPTGGAPFQLVITMKRPFWNVYYHPRSAPKRDSALNLRPLRWNYKPSTPGTKWIVTLASETLSSAADSPPEFNSTETPVPKENSTGAPLTALQAYFNSGLAGLTGKPLYLQNKFYEREFLYLFQNPTDTATDLLRDGAVLAVSGDKLRNHAMQWEFVPVLGEGSDVVYLRNKLNERNPTPSKQDDQGSFNLNYIRIETAWGEPAQLVIRMKETFENKYYHPMTSRNAYLTMIGRSMYWSRNPSFLGTKWIVTFASETLSSTVVHPPSSTLTPLPKVEISTVTPTNALQTYLRFGLSGLIGKPLNIENELYKGEFLYLGRNPTDRNASVLHDGATIAVGKDKLRERAFLWELVRIPGNDSSVVYLRNKIHELRPIPSKDVQYGRLNYIRIETATSQVGAEPSQLVILMRDTLRNQYYYHPNSIPNEDPELNGRDIAVNYSPSFYGTKWIVTLVS